MTHMPMTEELKPLLKLMGEAAERLEAAGMQREMVAMAAGAGALAGLLQQYDRREAAK